MGLCFICLWGARSVFPKFFLRAVGGGAASCCVGTLLPAALGPAAGLPAYLVHTMDMVFVVSMFLGAASRGSAVPPGLSHTNLSSKHGKNPC